MVPASKTTNSISFFSDFTYYETDLNLPFAKISIYYFGGYFDCSDFFCQMSCSNITSRFLSLRDFPNTDFKLLYLSESRQFIQIFSMPFVCSLIMYPRIVKFKVFLNFSTVILCCFYLLIQEFFS